MDLSAHEMLKTKAFLKSMQLGAAGWDVRVMDVSSSQEPVVWMYVIDHATNWYWCVSIARRAFLDIAKESRGCSEQLRQELWDRVGTCIMQAENGIANDGVDTDRALASAIALFAGTMKTASMIDEDAFLRHFVVINYGCPGDSRTLLRPFALSGSDMEAIHPEDLRKVVEEVVVLDRRHHPEWFIGPISSR
jgi:hypothetical protein